MLFILDNQCSFRWAQALTILEEGNDSSPYKCMVKHVKDFISGNSPDEEVIALGGRENAVIITYDRGFKELKQRIPLIKENNIGVVYFRSPKRGLRYWDVVKSLINNWEELKRMAHEAEKPFVFEVTSDNIIDRNDLFK